MTQRGVLSEDAIDASITTLREKLAALQTPSESLAQQRKQVTILFADIVNSTNMVKHIDPEDVWDRMRKDKKVQRGKLRLVIPVRIGRVEIREDVDKATIMSTLQETQESA